MIVPPSPVVVHVHQPDPLSERLRPLVDRQTGEERRVGRVEAEVEAGRAHGFPQAEQVVGDLVEDVLDEQVGSRLLRRFGELSERAPGLGEPHRRPEVEDPVVIPAVENDPGGAKDRSEVDRAREAAHGEPPRLLVARAGPHVLEGGMERQGADPRVPQRLRDGFRLDRGDRVEGRPREIDLRSHAGVRQHPRRARLLQHGVGYGGVDDPGHGMPPGVISGKVETNPSRDPAQADANSGVDNSNAYCIHKMPFIFMYRGN